MKQLIYISFVLILLSGCFGEEERLPELPAFVQVIETERSMDGQLYYSLRDRKVVKSNSIYDWDLAFSCKKGEFRVLVNQAKKMGIYNTQSKEIDVAYNSEYKNYIWEYTEPRAPLNSGCINNWGDFSFQNPQSFGDIYIINRGFDKFNLPYRMKKLRIDGFKNNSYEITFADVDGTDLQHLSIPKNDSVNYIYVSLDNDGEVKHLEPNKEDWDILFSNYLDSSSYQNVYTRSDSVEPNKIIYDGVLLNPFKHRVAMDTAHVFADMNFFDLEELSFGDRNNRIGNNWYRWSHPEKTYVISEMNQYVVESQSTYYYLIRFELFEKPHKDKARIRFAIRNL